MLVIDHFITWRVFIRTEMLDPEFSKKDNIINCGGNMKKFFDWLNNLHGWKATVVYIIYALITFIIVWLLNKTRFWG